LIEIGNSSVLQAYHYVGTRTKLYGTMLHDRSTDHWETGVRAQHVTKVLYRLWNDAGVKARQIVAAISLPGNLVLRFGRLPIAILEQGHMDLLGCWNSDRSALSPLDCLYWTNSTTLSEWCLISDALIESYRSHTDMNQGASYRSIMISALGCKGTNTSMSVTEGLGTSSQACLLVSHAA
jgi:hypothetical protein